MARKNRLPVQQFRGTDKDHETYTGLTGEITVCTTDWSLRVHNGAEVGGIHIVPIGTICLYPVQNVPLGWVPCNGTELDTVQYSGLYQLLGTTFGQASNGKFKVPNIEPLTCLVTGRPVYFMIKAV